MRTPRTAAPASRSARFPRLTAALVLVALAAAGCADDKPLNTFEPRGPAAERIDNLMMPIWPIMGVIFVAVVGGCIWLALKNRVNPDTLDPEDLPAQIHGNTRLEVAWTIAPGILLAAISIPVVVNIWALEETNAPDELDVLVIGSQWWWEYRYDVNGNGFFIDANGDGAIDELDEEWPLHLSLDPDDVVTATELVIPVGQQVDLQITSRDVIHSFWIPRLNGKRDAVPGRINTWSLEAKSEGKYTGWCTEFCGLSHARMRMSVIALPEDEFQQWLANQALPAEIPDEVDNPDAFAGRQIFAAQCVSCHVVRDGELDPGPGYLAALTAGAAPDLTHFATRSSFAGAIYGVYLGPGTDPDDDALNVADYLDLSQLASDPEPDGYRLNTPQLKRWIANAPEQKAMSPEDGRGMLPFPQLTDEQLDQIVAYLATLD